MKSSPISTFSLSSFVRRGRLLSLAALLGLGGVAVADEGAAKPVSFETLSSYTFTPADDQAKAPAAEAQIPATVKELDAKKVTVTGFMLPVKMSEGLVTEFLLMKDPSMCCFGSTPKVTEWVIVKMVGKGVQPLMDVPITFEGTFKVGQLYEGGYLAGLYLLQGERQVAQKG